MSSTPFELSPQQRLALSRRAIVRHMHRNDRPDRQATALDHSGYSDEHVDEDFDSEPPQGSGKWQLIKHTLSAWWRHHPAHLAVEVGKPLLRHYAQDQPMKLIGIAAAVGAATVLLRPWKLVSVGGLLLATLKSSQVTGLALSMLSRNSVPTTTPKDAS